MKLIQVGYPVIDFGQLAVNRLCLRRVCTSAGGRLLPVAKGSLGTKGAFMSQSYRPISDGRHCNGVMGLQGLDFMSYVRGF